MLQRAICFAVVLSALSGAAHAQLDAFPGAVGQGATTTGGRGGDVYHVTNLLDYNTSETPIPGSLRYGIDNTSGPRTIVFDVGGGIALHRRLSFYRDNLTIAGQTSPTGITLYGYPTYISGSNVILRYMRFRTGDFNVGSNGNMDLAADLADTFYIGNDANRVIVDHVSASWSLDETFSVTHATNVTVQNSIIAESFNDAGHPSGEHGFGSLLRGEVTASMQANDDGGYTFYGNYWAHHKERNPAIAGQQSLDPGQAEADRRRANVNLVNNVVYDWGRRPTHRVADGLIYVNDVGNTYINGPSSNNDEVFYESYTVSGDTHVYQSGNAIDGDQDSINDPTLINTQSLVNSTFHDFDSGDSLNAAGSGNPYSFFESVADDVVSAAEAYQRVIDSAGASLWRDAVDQRLINELMTRTGGIINSQEVWRSGGILPGIDDLILSSRPNGFDSDGDGMPDYFELIFGLNPNIAADGNGTSLSSLGYTNLEVYLNGLIDGFVPEPGSLTVIGFGILLGARRRRPRAV